MLEDAVYQSMSYAGAGFGLGFGGSVFVVSVVGAIVSGFKALSKLAGGK